MLTVSGWADIAVIGTFASYLSENSVILVILVLIYLSDLGWDWRQVIIFFLVGHDDGACEFKFEIQCSNLCLSTLEGRIESLLRRILH